MIHLQKKYVEKRHSDTGKIVNCSLCFGLLLSLSTHFRQNKDKFIKINLPARGDIGTAGFGAALEQSLPILLGGFNPDGLGRDEGRVASDFLTDAVVLVTDAASEDTDDSGAGGASSSSSLVSCISLIFLSLSHFKTLHTFC